MVYLVLDRHMNCIEVNQVMICYDYPEPYWVIDGKSITVYLEELSRWDKCQI